MIDFMVQVSSAISRRAEETASETDEKRGDASHGGNERKGDDVSFGDFYETKLVYDWAGGEDSAQDGEPASPDDQPDRLVLFFKHKSEEAAGH
jgi:hypothetical protein